MTTRRWFLQLLSAFPFLNTIRRWFAPPPDVVKSDGRYKCFTDSGVKIRIPTDNDAVYFLSRDGIATVDALPEKDA